MNLSGILVVVPSAEFDSTVSRLQAMDGVEVHQTDPDTGRLVVVQEAENVDAEVAGLKRIKALPHVVLAELVYHYFEEEAGSSSRIPDKLSSMEGLPNERVSHWLNR